MLSVPFPITDRRFPAVRWGRETGGQASFATPRPHGPSGGAVSQRPVPVVVAGRADKHLEGASRRAGELRIRLASKGCFEREWRITLQPRLSEVPRPRREKSTSPINPKRRKKEER